MKPIVLRLIPIAALLSTTFPATASRPPARPNTSRPATLCATAGPSRTSLNATARAATRFLKAVPAKATLARLKRLLPARTRYGAMRDTEMGSWTWHVIPFSGPLSGGLVFANNRRAAGEKQGLNENKPKDARQLQSLAKLRSGDPVHYIEVFLGGAAQAETPAAIRRETKSHMDAVTRFLGTPSKKEYTGNGDGPASYGWLAEWHLSRQRTIWFFTTMALLTSSDRPLLTLEFPYAHVYRS